MGRFQLLGGAGPLLQPLDPSSSQGRHGWWAQVQSCLQYHWASPALSGARTLGSAPHCSHLFFLPDGSERGPESVRTCCPHSTRTLLLSVQTGGPHVPPTSLTSHHKGPRNTHKQGTHEGILTGLHPHPPRPPEPCCTALHARSFPSGVQTRPRRPRHPGCVWIRGTHSPGPQQSCGSINPHSSEAAGDIYQRVSIRTTPGKFCIPSVGGQEPGN